MSPTAAFTPGTFKIVSSAPIWVGEWRDSPNSDSTEFAERT